MAYWNKFGGPRPEREPDAVQQIADARAEPTIEELQAQNHDPEIDGLAQRAKDGRFAAEQAPEPAVTLTGPRLAAYLRLEAAAKAAHAAQAGLAATGQELRDAIGELCKVVAG